METETALARDYVSRINEQAARAVIEIIRTGDLLTEAKAKLPHGMFERMFEDSPNRLPDYVRMSSRHGRTFMSIAASTAIRDNADRLSVNIKALAQIARLPDCYAQELIDAGAVNKNTTTSQAKRVVSEKLTGPKSEPGFRFDNQTAKPVLGSISGASANRNPLKTKSEPGNEATPERAKTKGPSVVVEEKKPATALASTDVDKLRIQIRNELAKDKSFRDEIRAEMYNDIIREVKSKVAFAEQYHPAWGLPKIPLKQAEYNLLLRCLHPDMIARFGDDELSARFAEGLAIVQKLKLTISKPDDFRDQPKFNMPNSLEEYLADYNSRTRKRTKKPAKEHTQ